MAVSCRIFCHAKQQQQDNVGVESLEGRGGGWARNHRKKGLQVCYSIDTAERGDVEKVLGERPVGMIASALLQRCCVYGCFFLWNFYCKSFVVRALSCH